MHSGADREPDILTPHTLPHPSVSQGKLKPAGARYREALWVLEASLGDDHPLLANVLIDIAGAKTKQLLLLRGGEVISRSKWAWFVVEVVAVRIKQV